MEEGGKKKEGKKGRKKIDERRKQASFCHFAILVFLSPIPASISKRSKNSCKRQKFEASIEKNRHIGMQFEVKMLQLGMQYEATMRTTFGSNGEYPRQLATFFCLPAVNCGEN